LQQPFRIGESYVVEPSLNRVTGPRGVSRLEPKVMLVLVCLAERAGQMVPKNQLLHAAWPDTAVTDDVLTRAISELRRLFVDDPKQPHTIETIAKSGYRLIAPVAVVDGKHDATPLAAGAPPGERRALGPESAQPDSWGTADAILAPAPAATDAVQEPADKRQASGKWVSAVTQAANRRMFGLVALVLLAGFAVGGWWIASSRRPSGGLPHHPTLSQLTANPPDRPVTSAQISPDGRYLAYADETGIQVRVIDTGETQRIAETRDMEVQGWSADGTRIRTAACDMAACTGWDLSLVGGNRRRSGASWPATDAVISTPDGSRLLRISGSSLEMSVDVLDGSAPRHLVRLGPNGSATWSANGERVLFTRGPALAAIESIPLVAGSSSVVFKAPDGKRIADIGLQLRDGRLLTLLTDADTNVFDLWEVQIDGGRGVASGPARRLTQWEVGGSYIGRFSVGVRADLRLSSASSDGKRVVVKRDMRHGDIYLARFDERDGRLLDTPRRITSDERGSYPGAWTPDGQTFVFNLGQSGSQDIFKQNLGEESAEPVVVGPGHQVLPRMSSDGRWVLFQEPLGAEGSRVMRVPLAGGRPAQVFATARAVWPRCAVRGRCVLFEQEEDQWVISSLDPVRGKGERLCSIPFNTRGEDLSPDGTAVAIVGDDGRSMNRIRIYSLDGAVQKTVVVQNVTALTNLDWSGTGQSFFSTSVTPRGRELLVIRMDGTSRVLWSPRGTPVSAIPSPDGTHLAIAGWTRQSNAWMMTNF
jgi:DNA-binding winged helix-turn-helix (wHTH) protein/Tol biopolymer transport system component